MRILITGSRDWDNFKSVQHRIVEAIQEWIKDHPGIDPKGPLSWVTIIHGGCPRGADRIADIFASQHKLRTEVYEAQWREFKKSAGYRRNKLMVDKGADVCLAFIRDNSPGSTGCRELAKRAGIATETFRYEDECEHWPVEPPKPYVERKGI